MLLLFLVVCFLTSLVVQYFYIKSETFHILDISNHRSMHKGAVKKSAGVFFILIAFFFSGIYFPIFSEIKPIYFLITIGTLFLMILGLLDDIYHLSSLSKMFLEILFFFPGVYFFLPSYTLLGFEPELPRFLISFLAILYIIFVINLCNFMDGLDLYLSLNFLSLVIVVFLLNKSITFEGTILLFVLFSLVGFMLFNRPKARVFMGDAGSLALGFLMAMSPVFIMNSKNSFEPGLSFFLLPVFWVDGMVTILKRLIRKENILKAHREHLYQRITLKAWKPVYTTIIFSLMNLLAYFVYIILQASDSFVVSFIICLLLYLGLYMFLEFYLRRKTSKT
ncbi:MAG: sugar phosphotransferase [Leptospiraceae bacterium]|nr:sugar phosphotransferase [Leptospiraceae bacterium]